MLSSALEEFFNRWFAMGFGLVSWLMLGVSFPSYLDALSVRCLALCGGMRSKGNVLGAPAALDVCLRGVGSNESHQHY
jgi:hypothetical protein